MTVLCVLVVGSHSEDSRNAPVSRETSLDSGLCVDVSFPVGTLRIWTCAVSVKWGTEVGPERCVQLGRCKVRFRLLKRLFVSLALLVALGGCGPRMGELTGSVFVVTEGGPSIKLGLVAVGAIDPVSMAPFVANRNSTVTPARDAADRYLAYWKEANRNNLADFNKAFEGPVDSVEGRLKINDIEFNALAPKLKEAIRLRRYWCDPARYFEGLPQAFAVAKTDADGKFVLRVPRRGRICIAAAGERELGKKSEAYYWLLWVDLAGQPTKGIILSNDNMMPTSRQDAVFPE